MTLIILSIHGEAKKYIFDYCVYFKTPKNPKIDANVPTLYNKTGYHVNQLPREWRSGLPRTSISLGGRVAVGEIG